MTSLYALDAFRHPNEFPEDVAKLFLTSEKENFELGSRWYANFIDTVSAKTGEAFFYVLKKNGTPIAAMPLLLIKKWYFFKTLHSLGNYYTSLYAPITATQFSASDFRELISKIKRRHPGITAFRLEPMNDDAEATSISLQALRENGFVCFKYFCFKNLFLTVKTDWVDYLASRDKKTLNTLRRKRKKLYKEGGSIEIYSFNPDLEKSISEYTKVYQGSWKKPEPFPDFIPGIIRTYSIYRSIVIGITRLKSEPIAAQIWVIMNNRASIFKLAYNEKYKSYSAGTLLTEKLMEHAISDKNVCCIDYMKGDEPHKRVWMDSSRDRVGVIAYSPYTFAGLLLIAKEFAFRGLKTAWAAWRRLKHQDNQESLGKKQSPLATNPRDSQQDLSS